MGLGGLASAEPLVVAGDKGVVELDDKGAIVRTLSKRASSAPRWSKDKKRIYYLSEGTLRVVGFDGKKDVLVARLPRSVQICATDETKAHEQAVSELSVQEDGDFVVDGKTACLSLKDRNENMVEIDLHVQIDLVRRKVVSGLLWPDSCGSSPPCHLWRAGREDVATPPAAPFEVADGHLVHDGKPVLDVGDFEGADYSASGRWQLLHGHEQDNDYIEFDALLLDRTDGALYAIGDGPAGHSKKLRKLGPAERNRVRTGKVKTAITYAEQSLFWIGERLVFGTQLVVPAERSIVDLPGDVIR